MRELEDVLNLVQDLDPRESFCDLHGRAAPVGREVTARSR